MDRCRLSDLATHQVEGHKRPQGGSRDESLKTPGNVPCVPGFNRLLDHRASKRRCRSTSQMTNEADHFYNNYVESVVVDCVSGTARDDSPTQR